MREGLLPTILGGLVTSLGISLRSKDARLSWGVTGFGLAHILLGSIDLLQHQSLEDKLSALTADKRQQEFQ
ncbi:asparagine synthase [Halanaerobaculum tunisiense]